MWVDIANLTGPRGRDGQDGEQGPPGPVNIGLDPNEPIAWDQSGGFTFNLVDGSQQTVNLPIASAQSAGLLGAGGALPTTGNRDISASLENGADGIVSVTRDGPIVTLSIDSVKTPGSGWLRLLNLPSGFRPARSMRHNIMAADHGHQILVNTSGTVYCNFSDTYTLRETFVYSTADAWPSSLPGT